MEHNEVNSKYVYHYTSVQTLFHLLDAKRLNSENKENEGLDKANGVQRVSLTCENLSFLATDIAALNDRTEYKEITNLISEMNKAKTIRLIDETIKGIPFVISFSTLEDWLPMWLNYADDGRGVCLKFDKEALVRNLIKKEEQYPEWIRADLCRYSKSKEFESLYKKVKDSNRNGIFTENIKENQQLYHEFSFQSAFLKDESFEPECEWRLVIFANNYLFYPNNNGRVARTRIDIPLSCLKEIRLGPCAKELDVLYVERIANLLVDSCGTQICVSRSSHPYRTFN